MIISLRPRFGRGRVAFAAVAVSVLVSGATSSVGATPLDNTPTNGVDNSPEFDIEKVPEQVLDDDTVLVTDAGIIIDEPEPFAGWPAEIVAQSVEAAEAADPEDSANADGSGSVSEAPTASQAFTLHSRPGADRTIYLDFDGHTTAGTAWNTNGRPASFTSAPYSRDSSAAFNTTELANIGEIWEQVAEDFAPFDVDVTTEEPSFDDL